MLRTVWFYAYLILSLVVRIPPMLRMGKAIRKEAENSQAEAVHRVTSAWARGLAKASGVRLHVEGLEHIPKDGALLFVSNHQSNFDIVVYLSCIPRPIGFVAKIEMLKAPLLRTWMKHMRCVFLDRKDIRQTAKVILEGIQILKSGHSMVLFPEGTRSKASEMLPFKAGSFKLATKSKTCIVPVTLNGSYKVVEENHYKIKPADVYVTFHPPMQTAALDAEALAAIPSQVEEVIRQGLTRP